MNRYEVLHGDCLEKLKGLADCSVDAVVTDPPYDLTTGSGNGGFMGKAWDGTGIAFRLDVWLECLRILKPGGHLLAFGGTRTYHRMACAIEDAGFEIRDSIHWMYGSGFPKSLDVSKAIDKMMGAAREVVANGKQRAIGGKGANSTNHGRGGIQYNPVRITAPATDSARQWSGFGTALKPSHEPIVVARKPLSSAVAQNVLAHGVGGINVDGCRVATSDDLSRINLIGDNGWKNSSGGPNTAAIRKSEGLESLGRWPPNTIFSHLPECVEGACADGCAVAELDRQSGVLKSGDKLTLHKRHSPRLGHGGAYGDDQGTGYPRDWKGDSGGASRFFPVFRYQAKAAPKERKVEGTDARHPTQKPVELMRWLVRLVTPPGGTVLDPFTGSGTTGVACILEGFRFVGCEREDEYLAIALARLAAAQKQSSGKQGELFSMEESS